MNWELMNGDQWVLVSEDDKHLVMVWGIESELAWHWYVVGGANCSEAYLTKEAAMDAGVAAWVAQRMEGA